MQAKQTMVDDHRNMLMLSKNISDFQENNLKSWAFIFLNNVDTVKVSWNFIRKNKASDFYAGKVDFDIKLKSKDIAPEDVDKTQIGVDQLIASTKFLFWSETQVKIKINGKTWTSQLQKDQEILPQPKVQV